MLLRKKYKKIFGHATWLFILVIGFNKVSESLSQASDNLKNNSKKASSILIKEKKSSGPRSVAYERGQAHFPEDFNWGFAICEYQNSGAVNCPNSNWSNWETTKFSNKTPHIKDGQNSGRSCDFWNHFEDDIALMKKMGIKSLRFSLAWEKIEPKIGEFDKEAIDHYKKVCDTLLSAGIKPMVTLHHFTHPMWFEKLDGFEKEENIKYFVRFAKKMFAELSEKVELWCTINEPTVLMLQGYIRGAFPPGKTSLFLGLKVLKNLLKAHVKVYKNLKKMHNGSNAQIGFVHQYLKFESYHSFNPIEKIPAIFFSYLMNGIVLNFLKCGIFNPRLVPNCYYKTNLKKIADFIGLNYYSRVLLKFQVNLRNPLIPTCYPEEIMTDMPYAIYPKGLYNAIKDVASIGLPIYITENGIADEKDDRRELFIKQYAIQLYNAVKDGYDVRGYYYWTFSDNFEWDEGFNMKFGLFKVDPQNNQRIMREGAYIYKDIINNQLQIAQN